MKIVPSVIALTQVRCACCSGQGVLCFYSCPSCGHIALVCDEVGTVFLNSKDLESAIYGGIEDTTCTCPSGDGVHVSKFTPSTHAQVLAASFRQEKFR